MEITIGSYIIKQRTEYSKIQIFDSNNKNISNTEEAKRIIEDYYLQKEKFEECFDMILDQLDVYTEEYDLEYIFLPDNICSIGMYAFEGSNIKKIHLPELLKNIEQGAFENCHNLQEIYFPESLITLEEDLFYNCENLEIVQLPSNITKIPKSIFNFCENLKEINLPDGLTDIGELSFNRCKTLKDIILPDTICNIGDYAFRYCKSLTKINLPRDLECVGSHAFEKNGINTLIINHNLYSKPNEFYKNIFEETMIEKLIINKNVEFIDPKLFSFGNKIKQIDYLGSKKEFKNLLQNNKELSNKLKKSKINMINNDLENIIKESEMKHKNKLIKLLSER